MIVQLPTKVRRRHAFVHVRVGDALEKKTLSRLPRNDRNAIFTFPKDAFPGVQAQLLLSFGLIRPVTFEAVVREERSDVSIEIDLVWELLRARGGGD